MGRQREEFSAEAQQPGKLAILSDTWQTSRRHPDSDRLLRIACLSGSFRSREYIYNCKLYSITTAADF